MKIVFVFLIFVFCCPYSTAANTSPKATAAKCKTVTKKINNTNSRLRAGYKVKQGEKLKTKLRKLRRLKRVCRQNNLPTEPRR